MLSYSLVFIRMQLAKPPQICKQNEFDSVPIFSMTQTHKKLKCLDENFQRVTDNAALKQLQNTPRYYSGIYCAHLSIERGMRSNEFT